ncbi:MAG: exopolysaccharide biosynthesis protein [Proteobacteria bacterium]|nr:exopolysaccharide biosynthesis protein [Pseudomonadota bacterium]
MRESGALLPTLDRLSAGPRESLLTIRSFVDGLGDRSYAFIIATLNVPNMVPTGIPFLSTVTGVPMVLLVVQYFLRRPTPWLPELVGRRSLPRGKLQDFLQGRARRHIEWIEDAIHPRHDWWVSGTPRKLMQITWALLIVLLALPIPFDNLIPAWAITFFCMALIERDGVMAMLGWLLTFLAILWTIFLLTIGMAMLHTLLHAIF